MMQRCGKGNRGKIREKINLKTQCFQGLRGEKKIFKGFVLTFPF